MKQVLFSIMSLFFVGLLLSCQQGSSDLGVSTNETSELSDEPHMCTELVHADVSRAFGVKRYFWNKRTLRVKFLGGSDYVRAKVKEYALLWTDYANIDLLFVESGSSDIRISFDTNSGSWSYVGRSNSYIPQNQATMNFGWFDDRTSDREFSRTVLHEFGHALGLQHEHQHPQASIPWNEAAVYRYYNRNYGWSEDDVDNNILSKYTSSYTNYSQYDPASIMHYYIPRSLVIGSWTPRVNSTLSDTDKAFIQSTYPY